MGFKTFMFFGIIMMTILYFYLYNKSESRSKKQTKKNIRKLIKNELKAKGLKAIQIRKINSQEFFNLPIDHMGLFELNPSINMNGFITKQNSKEVRCVIYENKFGKTHKTYVIIDFNLFSNSPSITWNPELKIKK